MLQPLLYFGHPVNTYNTELEKQAIRKIAQTFPTAGIENPNQPHHEQNYQAWKTKYGNGMNYYYQQVLPACWAGIFLPFRDGLWGAGIYGEAQFFFNLGSLLWKIELTNEESWLFKITPIVNMDTEKRLTVEETRERTKLSY